MNLFESINETSDKIADAGETYVKKSKEYFKLKVFQQLTISISVLAKVLIFGGLLFSALIFLAFAAALAIGTWLESLALGYLIIGSVFVIIGILVYLKRSIINQKIIQSLSHKFFDSE